MLVVGIKTRAVLWHRCWIHFSSEPEPIHSHRAGGSLLQWVMGVSLL